MPLALHAKRFSSAAALALTFAATPAFAVDAPPATALAFTGQLANAEAFQAVTPDTVFDFWSLSLDPFAAFTINPGESFVATVSLDGAYTLPAATGNRFIRLFLYGPDLDTTGSTGTQGGVDLYFGADLVAGFPGQGCLTSASVASCVSLAAPGSTALTFDKAVFTFTVDTLDMPRTASTAVFDTVVTTPVPEAQTWALLTAGLALLGALGHRRRARPEQH